MNKSNQPHDDGNATEIARLILQDRLLSQIMPQIVPKAKLRRALDIGCGPGGWVIDVAHHFPKSTIIGIDISPATIPYTSDLAALHGFKNCQFQLMDALKPLAFSDQFFDLVNIRAMVPSIPRKGWPTLLQECHRITQPGGTLQLMEIEGITTNSPALVDYSRFCCQLLYQRGYGFSLDGGMTPQIGKQLLVQAGYQNTWSNSFTLDFSAGMDSHGPQSQSIESFFVALHPLIIQAKIAPLREFEKTYAALRNDLSSQSFQGSLSFCLVCGERAFTSSKS